MSNALYRHLQYSKILAGLVLAIVGCVTAEAASFSDCVKATQDYIRSASNQGRLLVSGEINPLIEANNACRSARNKIGSAKNIVNDKFSKVKFSDDQIKASSIAFKKDIYKKIQTGKVHQFDTISNLALLIANQVMFPEDDGVGTEQSFVFARIPAGLVSVNGQETQVGLYLFGQQSDYLARARQILEMLKRWEEQGDWQDITDQLVSKFEPNTTVQPWDEIGILIDMSVLATDQLAGDVAWGGVEGALGSSAGVLIASLFGVVSTGGTLLIAAGMGAASAGFAAWLDSMHDESKDTDGDGTPDYRDEDKDGDGVPNWRDDYPEDKTRHICSWCPRGHRLIDATMFQDNIFYFISRFRPEDMINNMMNLQIQLIRNLVFQPFR